MLDDAHVLERTLGGADRQKLDQYLSSVRELEQRIARAEKLPPVELPDGDAAARGAAGRPDRAHPPDVRPAGARRSRPT